jgi:hypothetical protein
VNYSMVQQTSLASTEYPRGTNEFIKAGFTELKSEIVRPPRVAQSPVQFECIVRQVISLGETPGAGNIVLAEIKLMHISEEILNEAGKIDQTKVDLVARLGGDWYCRVTKESLFQVAKPNTKIGIGFDALPLAIRNSKVLTGNHLGQLANVEVLPEPEEIKLYFENESALKPLFLDTENDLNEREKLLHQRAGLLLDQGKVGEAWLILLIETL